MSNSRIGSRFSASVFCLVLAVGGCASSPVPVSVPQAKADAKAYVESGRYHRDQENVIARARRYLDRRIGRFEKPAIVLDIDDTALSTWEFVDSYDFCFNRDRWQEWLNESLAPALKPTLSLYRHAVENEVDVFFVTGRREPNREITERNLRQAGYTEWVELHMRGPGEEELTAEAYKKAVRREIESRGYTIVLSVGDQDSDLAGGHAKRTFKVPNPFYGVP